jgi:hypothetical protein
VKLDRFEKRLTADDGPSALIRQGGLHTLAPRDGPRERASLHRDITHVFGRRESAAYDLSRKYAMVFSRPSSRWTLGSH